MKLTKKQKVELKIMLFQEFKTEEERIAFTKGADAAINAMQIEDSIHYNKLRRGFAEILLGKI